MVELLTVGYQETTVDAFLATLDAAEVGLVVDVRAVAASRRPGFSKRQLAANLATVGIDYLHLRDLGTPAEGRLAARRGRHDEMRRIFAQQLLTEAAVLQMAELEGLARAGQRLCLLCFERDPTHCHRSLVADGLAERLDLSITHLRP